MNCTELEDNFIIFVQNLINGAIDYTIFIGKTYKTTF